MTSAAPSPTLAPAAGSLRRTLLVAATGAAATATAMGVGRFAYTSILPMMINAGVLDLHQASTIASLNYLGYLIGAMACMVLPERWSSARLVRFGLAATVLLTLGMAVQSWPLWLVLRALSGIVSGLTLVHSARWCLSSLAALGRPFIGGLMFTGVGLGIAASGLAIPTMIAAGWSWAEGWAIFALFAAVLTGLGWPILHPAPARLVTGAAPATPAAPPPAAPRPGLIALFTLAYGLAGFGYIITATYLPVIARAALPGSSLVDLFWPIFGVAAALGSALAVAAHRVAEPGRLLIGCFAIQAVGVAVPALWPSPAGFVLGSLLAGGPFTALNYFALQDARRLSPGATARFMGLLTAVYAIGQILGPPLVQLIMKSAADASAGFDLALFIAASTLAIGAALCLFVTFREGRPAATR